MRLINLEPQSSHGCYEYHNVQKQEIRRCFMNIDASQIKLYSTDWSPKNKTSDRKHLETTIFQERLTHPKNKNISPQHWKQHGANI